MASEIVNDLSWTIGGPQGSGVDSAATAFARACAAAGLEVFGNREYYSNIMGEHSYYQVRVRETPVLGHTDAMAMLASFDAETVFRHVRQVVEGGAVLFDPQLNDTKVAQVATLENPVRQDLGGYLEQMAAPATLASLLAIEARRGILLVPVPYALFIEEARKKFNIDHGKAARMVNMIAVGASLGLVGFSQEWLGKALLTVFRAKPKVGEMNLWVATRALEYTAHNGSAQFRYRLRAASNGDSRILINGSQAVALGKIAAGCRFQTYYPITPASDESVYLEAHELVPLLTARDSTKASEKNGMLVVQTEDEIAAITMATGAALTGVRSATATSGPGYSLMVEGLGWAGMNEVPVVITLYQRGGPSTGLPTRHEQGDLRFVLHSGHGEFPRLVLASGDIQEAFADVFKVFNWAERYQVPVIHLLDKALANSSTTLPPLPGRGGLIERGEKAESGHGTYLRFRLTPTGISPRALLGQEGTVFWNTGDEHDERGHISEDPGLRNRMMEKRMGKLAVALQEIPDQDQAVYHGPPEADLVVVSWGSTKGAILEALPALHQEGCQVGFLQLRLLNPFPSELVARHLRNSQTLVDVEMNYSGQLAGLVREFTGVTIPFKVIKFNGRPISSPELLDALRAIRDGRAPAKQVLCHGV